MKVPFQVAWHEWDTAENVFHRADIVYDIVRGGVGDLTFMAS